MKNFAHGKVKREDWNGRKREKVGQLCPSTETGTVQGWAMVNCIHLIKQSMTASSRKATVLPKNVPELDPTNSRYPLLNYPKSRIELVSVLAIILKDTLYREKVGRVWKWVVLIRVGSKPFLTCFRQFFFYTLAALDYFFSYFNLIIYPPAILPCSQNWEKAHRGMAVLTRRGVDDGVRATLRFLSKVDFFPFFSSLDWNGSKKDSTPTMNI